MSTLGRILLELSREPDLPPEDRAAFRLWLEDRPRDVDLHLLLHEVYKAGMRAGRRGKRRSSSMTLEAIRDADDEGGSTAQ